MASWVESTAFVASEPARLAVLISLAQANWALDDASLSQSAGLVHQQVTGSPVETAVIMAHLRALADHDLVERDDTGFRWRMTPLGELVIGQWASAAFDPPGEQPLGLDEVRAWRDRLFQHLEESAALAEQAGVSLDELAAGCALRLSELRVLNRVIAEERVPGWIEQFRQPGIASEE